MNPTKGYARQRAVNDQLRAYEAMEVLSYSCTNGPGPTVWSVTPLNGRCFEMNLREVECYLSGVALGRLRAALLP